MIETNITGRLGNQLFQYACARQLQYKYGGEIVLNTYELNKKFKQFRLELCDFTLNDEVVVESIRPLSKGNANNLSVKFFRKYFPKAYFNFMAKRGVFIWKSATEYIPLPDMQNTYSHIILNGYWQSDKYFPDIEDILRKEITPKCHLLESNRKMYNLITNSESVCVTIRRGDFLTAEHKNRFYICDEDYFSRAINLICEKIPNCVFFAFSDDISWVKENIKFPNKTFYESGNDPVWEKMRLMSACRHFVISNSSFSWWAQYLSPNKDKIVIAPDFWLNGKDGKDSAIYQDNWQRISVRLK